MRKYDNILTKEILEELYLNQGKTHQQISMITGVPSLKTISKYLKLANITSRRPNDVRKEITMKGMSDENFTEYLKDLYFNQKLSCNKIANLLGVSHTIVYRYFQRYGIQRLDRLESIKMFSTGKNNPKWNNNKNIKGENDYIMIRVPDHPHCDPRGYVYQHRLIMEESLGRYLKPSEVVHHENENKQDNNLKNLRLFKNSKEHAKYHFEKNSKNLKINNWLNSYEKDFTNRGGDDSHGC